MGDDSRISPHWPFKFRDGRSQKTNLREGMKWFLSRVRAYSSTYTLSDRDVATLAAWGLDHTQPGYWKRARGILLSEFGITPKNLRAMTAVDALAVLASRRPKARGVSSRRDTRKVLHGVSMLDAALRLNDGDKEAALKTKKRWANLRCEKPGHIGKFDAQTFAFSPSAISAWIEKNDIDFPTYGTTQAELCKALKSALREVANPTAKQIHRL